MNTAASWSGNSGAGLLTGGTAVFNLAADASHQPNLSSAISIGQINFSTTTASGYDLTSSFGNTVALTLTNTGGGGSSAIRAANTSNTNTIDAALILGGAAGTTQTFTQAASGTLQINGNISGGSSTSTLSLNCAGATPGLIKLAGANTFTSNVELIGTGSVISVSSIGIAGSSSNLGAGTTITFSSSSTLKYTGSGETSNKTIVLNNTSGATIDTSAATGALILTGDLIAPASGAKTVVLTGGATSSEFKGKIVDGAGGGTTKLSINGLWILSGANTFSGGVALGSTATLGIKDASALGTGTFTPGQGSIDNLTGASLTLSTNNAITINNSNGFTFLGSNDLNMGTGTVTLAPTASTGITVTAGVLTFGGNFVESAAGKSFSKSGAGTLVLNGNLSYTGTTTINAGTLVLAGDNSSATGQIKLAGSTAVLNIGSSKALGTGTLYIASAGTIDNTSGSALTLSTNNAITIGSGFTFAGSNDLNLGTGAVALSSSATVTVNAHTLTIGGNIASSTRYLTKAGSGTLVLAGTNANTGKITVSAGTLQFAQIASLLAGSTTNYTTSNLQVESGATLAVNVGGSGEFTSTELDALKSVGSATAGFKAGSSLGIDTTSGDFTYNSSIGDVTYSGGTNALGITKLGANTLTLTGNNTYTGATTISAGTLAVNGSLAVGSVVTVNSGATLGGSGTVNGTVSASSATINGSGSGLHLGATTLYGSSTLSGYNIASSVTVASGSTTLTGTTQSTSTLTVSVGATLNNKGTVAGNVNVNGGFMKGTGEVTGDLSLVGGTLAPGNSAGITTVDGNFSMDAASKLVAEVSGTVAGISYDQVKVSGNVSLAGTLDLTTLGGLTMGSEIILINNDGTGTTTGYFSSIITSGSTYTLASNADYKFTVGSAEYLLSFTSNAGNDNQFNDVTLAVVPEPSSWAMFVGGLGMLICGQRLRKR